MMENRGVSFEFAARKDEPDIRRLLRENAMEGQLHISLEREPDAFAADFGMPRMQDFVIARDLNTGEAIGVCERVVHECYVNGKPALLPYIGALRVAASHRNRIGVIKGGFAKLRSIADAGGVLPFALTSISRENHAAMRLLCAGLPGLPRYEPVGDFSTFLMAANQKQPPIDVVDPPTMAEAANDWNARHQFAKVWKETDVERLFAFGLAPESCLGIKRSGKLNGCIGLWDQRLHRQTVIRQYPFMLKFLRPLLNVVAAVTGRPPLPRQHTAMNVAVASHFAWLDGREETFVQLIKAALGRARKLGIAAVAFGFASQGPCHAILRGAFSRAMEFRTKLFKVYWPDEAGMQTALDGKLPHPELGVL